MKSEAKNVTAYLADVPAERRDALKRVATLKGCEESIDYGMPCYKRDGELVASFASQKQYIALYGMGKAVERYRKELTGCYVARDVSGFGARRRWTSI